MAVIAWQITILIFSLAGDAFDGSLLDAVPGFLAGFNVVTEGLVRFVVRSLPSFL